VVSRGKRVYQRRIRGGAFSDKDAISQRVAPVRLGGPSAGRWLFSYEEHNFV
jgi:hypothetical protein